MEDGDRTGIGTYFIQAVLSVQLDFSARVRILAHRLFLKLFNRCIYPEINCLKRRRIRFFFEFLLLLHCSGGLSFIVSLLLELSRRI